VTKIVAWLVGNVILCAMFFLLALVLPFKKEAERVKAKISFRGCGYHKALVEYEEYRKVIPVSAGLQYAYDSEDVIDCLLVKKYTLFGGYKGYDFVLEDNPNGEK